MKHRLSIFLVSVSLLAAAAPPDIAGAERRAGNRTSWKLIEPVESRHDTILLSARGRARVRWDGRRRQRIRLGRAEQLTEIAEISRGWAAAGVKTRGRGTDLFFFSGSAAEITRLPDLATPSPGLRGRPQLFSDSDSLAGVAWLEGTDLSNLRVRAADWSGLDWGPGQAVTPNARIRSGLTAAVLYDGSWLLVWSEFDGEDDELVWSRRKSDGWSAPARVTAGNRAPDITPALLATRTGALLAWSRYDGNDYRIVTASFKRGEWQLRTGEGPQGSLYPSFKNSGDASILLFRNALPAAWTALRLDETGGVEAMARSVTEISERPVLKTSSAGLPVFDWPLLRVRSQQRWESSPR